MVWSPRLPPPRPTAASARFSRGGRRKLQVTSITFHWASSSRSACPDRPPRSPRSPRSPASSPGPSPPTMSRASRPAAATAGTRRLSGTTSCTSRPTAAPPAGAHIPTAYSRRSTTGRRPARGGAHCANIVCGPEGLPPPRPRGRTPPTRTIRPHPGSPPPPRTTWASRHTPDHPDRAGRSRSRGRRPSPPSSNKTPHQMGTASCMTRSSGSGVRSSIRPSTPHPTTSSGLMSPRTHWSAQRAKSLSLKGRAS